MFNIMAAVMLIFTNGGANGRLLVPSILDDHLESKKVCETRKAEIINQMNQQTGYHIICVE